MSVNIYDATNDQLHNINGTYKIKAEYDTTPATAHHYVGDILWFNKNTYTVTTEIQPGNTITATGTNANIEILNNAGIPVYVKNMPGSGGGGGSATVLYTFYVGATITTTIQEGTIIYYLDKKLYNVKRTISGTVVEPYTIVPATDLEAPDLEGDEMVTVEGIPGSGLDATDVDFDNTDTSFESDNVDGVLRELNSKIDGIVIARANGNQTFAAQFTTLYTAYNTLSNIEKAHSKLCRLNVDDEITEVYPIHITTSGNFGFVHSRAGAGISMATINLSSNTFEIIDVDANGGTHYAEYSASTNSTPIVLMVG